MRTKNEEYFKMIEAFIDEYKEKTGAAPTVQEISYGIGVPKTTVGRYLAYMREHGMLDYTGHRNIQTKAFQMIKGETIVTPILGKVKWHCSNCGHIVTGSKNQNGVIKVKCNRCQAVMVRRLKSMWHDNIVRILNKLREHENTFPFKLLQRLVGNLVRKIRYWGEGILLFYLVVFNLEYPHPYHLYLASDIHMPLRTCS